MFAALAAFVFVLGVVVHLGRQRRRGVRLRGTPGLGPPHGPARHRPSRPPTSSRSTVEASGQQWIWRYEYPDGTFSYYELVVPVDTAVVVKLVSTDVVHRWWVPGPRRQVRRRPRPVEPDLVQGRRGGHLRRRLLPVLRRLLRGDADRVTGWSASRSTRPGSSSRRADIQAAQAFVQEQVAATHPATSRARPSRPTSRPQQEGEQ